MFMSQMEILVDTEKYDYKKNWLKSFCSNLKRKYKKIQI